MLLRRIKQIVKEPHKILRVISERVNLYKIRRAKSKLNKEEILISVVIPIYDRTWQLRQSIDSILNQTFQNFELILVCDGSPEDTLTIVRTYENNPKVRVFYFSNNSGNAVRGRNKAIKEARGLYLAFQDSDDIAEPDRLKVSLSYIEKNNVDVVYGSWIALVEDREINIENNQIVNSPDCDYEMLLNACVPCQSTVMAKVSALRDVGGLNPNMLYREDHELWLRLAYFGYKFKSIRTPLVKLRLHANNLELKFKDSDDFWVKFMLENHKQKIKMKPKIAYVIPGCGISGGIAVICQHLNRLLERGYDVMMISERYDDKSIDWFPNQKVPCYSILEAPDNLDIVVATGWTTAFTIAKINAKQKYYFVQSDESRFYPIGSNENKQSLESYKFDYSFITEAKWIVKWLKETFNKESFYAPNGIDLELFYEIPKKRSDSRVRVLLEGPIDIPFKGMEDAFNAVQDLDCEIWCISSAGRPKKHWRCDRFFEKVPMEQMKEIYSQCDILLKMSRVEGFFGPPLEMMACGGAVVVAKVSGYDEYIKNEYNALVVNPNDVEGAKFAVDRLIRDKELRNLLISNGFKTAREWSWDVCIDSLEKIYSRDN